MRIFIRTKLSIFCEQMICSKCRSLNFGFTGFIGGPGGFRKVPEVKKKKTSVFAKNGPEGAEL